MSVVNYEKDVTMTVIGTNVTALRTSYAANQAEMGLAKSIERLSTGRRINSASDDAAGNAMFKPRTSEVMRVAMALPAASSEAELMRRPVESRSMDLARPISAWLAA